LQENNDCKPLLNIDLCILQKALSIYLKGDYEELYALKAAKNKANSKPISNAGSDAEWIPAFAGMTNNKYPRLSALICG
jgi:hypothetical protein